MFRAEIHKRQIRKRRTLPLNAAGSVFHGLKQFLQAHTHTYASTTNHINYGFVSPETRAYLLIFIQCRNYEVEDDRRSSGSVSQRICASTL